jgi:outer membrane protein assembly factor BamB
VEAITALTVGPGGVYGAANTLGLGAVFQFNTSPPSPFIPFNAPGDLTVPVGMTFGPNGNLYVGSVVLPFDHPTRGQILEYNGSTGAFINTFVSPGSGGLSSPTSLIFAGASLLVSGGQQGVLRYNATTGAFQGTFVAPGSGGLSSASYMVFGPDGNLYVSNGSLNDVLRFDGATGAFLGTFVAPGSGGLDYAQGIAFGSDGNLYVSSYFTHSVLEYNGSTGAFIGTAFKLPETIFGQALPTYLYSAIPEPSSLVLLATGLIAAMTATMAVKCHRRRRCRGLTSMGGNAAS